MILANYFLQTHEERKALEFEHKLECFWDLIDGGHVFAVPRLRLIFPPICIICDQSFSIDRTQTFELIHKRKDVFIYGFEPCSKCVVQLQAKCLQRYICKDLILVIVTYL